MVFFSGTITAFFRFIASPVWGVEAKLVQRSPIRARNFNGEEGGLAGGYKKGSFSKGMLYLDEGEGFAECH